MITRIALLCLLSSPLYAQVTNTAMMDSADYKVKGRVSIEGFLDCYYAYNFNEPENNNQPYLVSMARHNEININLALIDLKYSSHRIRARVVPGFGTYVNANYARENGSLKNLIEANTGIKLFKSKAIWLDVGVLGSPYTNESAISKDHLAYTRSFAAENVPYYLSGVKLSLPLSKKVNTYFYLVNGWQQISDQSSSKCFATQFEYRPTGNLLLNWNTYIGNEQSAIDSVKGLRIFSDVFMIYNNDRWAATASVYAGQQQAESGDRYWWQANIIGRYAISPEISVSARGEYFQDNDGSLIIPITQQDHFRSYGTSMGININVDSNLLFRTEARYLFSDLPVYKRGYTAVNNSFSLTTSVCVWF